MASFSLRDPGDSEMTKDEREQLEKLQQEETLRDNLGAEYKELQVSASSDETESGDYSMKYDSDDDLSEEEQDDEDDAGGDNVDESDVGEAGEAEKGDGEMDEAGYIERGSISSSGSEAGLSSEQVDEDVEK